MNRWQPLILIATGIFLAVAPFILIFLTSRDHQNLSLADQAYLKGVEGKTLSDREENFNQAFKIYQTLETKYHPSYGNGKLYYNLANTLYQLNQPAEALYYYHKAKNLQPRNSQVLANLSSVYVSMGLKPPSPPSIWQNVFFFHFKLSLPERLILVGVFSLATLIFVSLYIWFEYSWMLSSSVFFSLLLSIFISSALYTRYLEPLQGVLVKSSTLRKDSGFHYAKISEEPLPQGTVLNVLAIEQKGAWIKVRTSQNVVGYLFYDTIRLL